MNVISIPGFSDPFSSLSHLLAAFIFFLYGIRLIGLARGHRAYLIAVSVFVFSVVFLLTMSGVFHLLDHKGLARLVLQRLDHAAIFALIAGTFTPVHVILFKGFWRWGFLIIIWGLAIIGITWKSLFFNDLAEWLGLMFYLVLGWAAIFSASLTHSSTRIASRSVIMGPISVDAFIGLPIFSCWVASTNFSKKEGKIFSCT